MKILWCGPYFSEYAFTGKKSLNIAATVWSHGFVRGLKENGCNVHVVTLCPEQAWPAGRVFWQGHDDRLFDHDVPVSAISYLNVAHLREIWQSFFFARKVRNLLLKEIFDALICYNVLHPYHVAAMREARKGGVPTFPIILDGGYDVVKEGLLLQLFEGNRPFEEITRHKYACFEVEDVRTAYESSNGNDNQ